MFGLGVPELMIILVIVVVLFGASRLSGLGGAMGSSIREFRKSVRDDERPADTTTVVTTVRDEKPSDTRLR